MSVEYRVKQKTTFFVTRYQDDGASGECREIGNGYDSEETAFAVAYALCRSEHDKAGTEPGDPNFIYPKHTADAAQANG